MGLTMPLVQSIALLAAVVVAVLLVLLAVLLAVGALWRFLPLSPRWSGPSFIVFALFPLTPMPVHLGVGAMIYPAVVLYQDLGQLEWHFFNWYLKTPLLVVPSILATVGMAYFVAYRVFPNRTYVTNGSDEP